MTHLSLFSGVGGLDLAAHWAGFTTVQFVEREPYCQKILAKNFPGVDIADDVTTFDGRPFRGRITCLSGGFPCQDISQAGKQEGLAGKRSGLWFEMLRIIGEVRPAWVVAENVGALIRMGIDVCLAGLEAEGYTTRTVVFPACGVGAVHRRERCFIIGKRTTDPSEQLCDGGDSEPRPKPLSEFGDSDSAGNARNSDRERSQGQRESGATADPITCHPSGGGLSGEPRRGAGQKSAHRYTPMAGGDWRAWDVKPVFRKSDDELPAYMVRDRVNILKALGNAVCPNQAYPIFQAIAKEVNA